MSGERGGGNNINMIILFLHKNLIKLIKGNKINQGDKNTNKQQMHIFYNKTYNEDGRGGDGGR